MQLEFLSDISDGGKYPDVVSDNLIRLFEFDASETELITRLILKTLIKERESIELADFEFINPVNCRLTMMISDRDYGIIKTEIPDKFTCKLTRESYFIMIERMREVSDGHNWLCDTSNGGIDFLYSPGGTW